MSNNIYLALGTNLGDREANLDRTCELLSKYINIQQKSAILENQALLLNDSPAEWDIPYFNIVLHGTYESSISELFTNCKNIEQEMGRDLNAARWSPRIIDIDLLAIESLCQYKDEHVTIPHIGLLERDFFLKPLAKIAPDWQYPLGGINFGKTAKELACR